MRCPFIHVVNGAMNGNSKAAKRNDIAYGMSKQNYRIDEFTGITQYFDRLT